MKGFDVAVPWMIEDHGVLYVDVTLEGHVDLTTREVTGIRATDDETGLEIDIPEAALDAARTDLIDTAEENWRRP